jgi:hypothetical protein
VAFWLIVLLFLVAQNAQVAIYGAAFSHTRADASTLERIIATFKDPLFLVALVGLSVATATGRLWLFPEAGVARTHVITSAAVVASFAIFSMIFNEGQSLTRYAGVVLCAIGIFLVAR